MLRFLTNYQDVFAWSYQDMPGLNTDIVVHKLPLIQDMKPVKQKLRRLKPEWSLKIKEEVKKHSTRSIHTYSIHRSWSHQSLADHFCFTYRFSTPSWDVSWANTMILVKENKSYLLSL